jgi:hypothetical protein
MIIAPFQSRPVRNVTGLLSRNVLSENSHKNYGSCRKKVYMSWAKKGK